MHFKALTSMAFLGLAVIAPLVLAHPSEKDSRAVSREPAKHATPTKTPDIDLNECYRVNSPACDKAYADAEAQYLKDNPGYNPNAEPYPDSKRKTNICKCTGSLLAGGYKGQCKYGDGYGYTDSVCFPGRGMCCTWCCRDATDGWSSTCVPTTHDPNCPGDSPDSKAY